MRITGSTGAYVYCSGGGRSDRGDGSERKQHEIGKVVKLDDWHSSAMRQGYFLRSFDQDSKGLIHRCGIRKSCCNIGLERDHDDIMWEPFCVLPSDRVSEVILFPHLFAVSVFRGVVHIASF